jgi:hypothetical protein
LHELYRILLNGGALGLVARRAFPSVIPAKAAIHALHQRYTRALRARFAVAIHPDLV